MEELENPNAGGGKNYGIAAMLKAELPMLRVIHQKQQLQLRGVVSPVFHPGKGGGGRRGGGCGSKSVYTLLAEVMYYSAGA